MDENSNLMPAHPERKTLAMENAIATM